MNNTENNNRVLGRQLARSLTAEEIDSISGAKYVDGGTLIDGNIEDHIEGWVYH